MSLEDNKTVARRLLEEALAQGNLEVFDTSLAPNLVVHVYGTPTHSHASARKLTQQFHQAVSGHTVTIHDLIAEGNTVAARFSYTASGHHSQFGNNPPTSQPIQLESSMFFHFEQGKMTEMWVSYQGVSFDLSPT